MLSRFNERYRRQGLNVSRMILLFRSLVLSKLDYRDVSFLECINLWLSSKWVDLIIKYEKLLKLCAQDEFLWCDSSYFLSLIQVVALILPSACLPVKNYRAVWAETLAEILLTWLSLAVNWMAAQVVDEAGFHLTARLWLLIAAAATAVYINWWVVFLHLHSFAAPVLKSSSTACPLTSLRIGRTLPPLLLNGKRIVVVESA